MRGRGGPTDPSRLRYGTFELPPLPTHLMAGETEAWLQGAELVRPRRGDLELAARLLVAVRDERWGTVPGQVSDVRLEAVASEARATFQVSHEQGELSFAWQGEVLLQPEMVSYAMEGVARSSFRYNRIGICVLHAFQLLAGRRFRARGPLGSIEGRLPELIGPQMIKDGVIQALFPAFSELSIELLRGTWVDLRFEGDLFEMEDQRNWADGTFKTYSTPLALGFPHTADEGLRISQRVTIRVRSRPRSPRTIRSDGPIEVRLGTEAGRLPPIGLSMPGHGHPPGVREMTLLRQVRPAHLRVDARMADPASERDLDLGRAVARELGCGIELAVYLGEDPERELERLAGRLDGSLRLHRLLLFRYGEPVTDQRWLRRARAVLKGRPFGDLVGGTDGAFVELNRVRPVPGAEDGLAYSINPQVHGWDELTLRESLAASAETVRTARSFAAGRKIVVTPVTLRPRLGPEVPMPSSSPTLGRPGAGVDPRQASLFGAGWTLGSVKYLAEAGAASLTYFELTGGGGVMDQEPSPRLRPVTDLVYPLFHVLADLGEIAGSCLVEAVSSAPLDVVALAARSDGQMTILVANLIDAPRELLLVGAEATAGVMRSLDMDSASLALRDPMAFRGTAWPLMATAGGFEVRLAPLAVARLVLREEAAGRSDGAAEDDRRPRRPSR